ncbi:MAG TPA: DUF1295 domain-containing protein [Opitutaceae bacterium]|nr:DUF1295 domain-containing protein [Opitutaceae bacterium]
MLPAPLLVWSVAAVALATGFALLFGWTRRRDNFGYVDVGWAAAFTVIAAWFAVTGPAPGWRRVLVLAAVASWSLRLALHLARRIAAHHPVEDARYTALRRAWADRLDLKMRLFFQGQAVSVLVLAWPLFAITRNPAPSWLPLEILGVGVVLLAIAGEAVADAQLRAFQRRHPDRREVCAEGLWRYSRHPNYFFEWLVWIGFALWAWPAPGGPVGLASPALMLFLLLKVTGIRYTEEQLERSKGAAYLRYRARTSAFVPWPPRDRAAPPPCL